MRATWLLLLALSGTACLRQTEFHCETSAECGAGTCEVPFHLCSFPDPDCNGNRFGDAAGTYANQCVASVSTDAGVADSPTTPMPDAPPVGCPNLYNQLPGGSPHLYRLFSATMDWTSQANLCKATSSSAYLAIPGDATELQALSTLSGVSQYWVGLTDAVTENTFLTVRGDAAPYLPWTGGAPNNNGPGEEDCVKALSATSLIDDDKCNTKLAAICECDP